MKNTEEKNNSLDSPFKLSSVGFNRVNPPLQIKGLSGK
jgi:hypothetical protein